MWLRRVVASLGAWRAVLVGAVLVLTLGVVWTPASAVDDDPGEPSPTLGCLSTVTGSMWASTSRVTDRQTATVYWSANVPWGCTGVTVTASGRNLFSTSRSASKSLTPLPESNGYAIFQLKATRYGMVQPLGNLAIKVDPRTSVAYGRTTVHVSQSVTRWFVDAIATANTTILLTDGVNINLSGYENLNVMPGVHILGDRSSTRLGPRLFTTTKPRRLLVVGTGYQYHESDGVRISGIRLDGGNMGIEDPDGPIPVGITVNSSVNVEIANNEIYGWSGIGVQVYDQLGRLNLGNATAVWVHDNYIHHNRHWRTEGYGVAVHETGYVLIERNVFDYNRHAIESNNPGNGNGYLAYHNLLLSGGGENCCLGVAVQHTHQFDVHGSLDCGGKGSYCGPAGEYFDYRYNSLAYTSGDAIKLRGYPARGADVANNVFANSGSYAYAYVQTDGDNLRDHGNNLYPRTMDEIKDNACDFDGDGNADDFYATGQTWWFRGVTQQWQYLNTRTRTGGYDQLRDLAFADVNGDGRCDVKQLSEGAVLSGGRAKRLANGIEVTTRRADVVWQPGAGGGGARIWMLGPELTDVAKEYTAPLATDQRVVGTGDFNGDGSSDLLVRNLTGQVSVSLLDSHEGRVVDPIGGRSAVKGDMPWSAQVVGVGDFNADGRSDVLWRHTDGPIEIWFAAEKGNSAKVSWQNRTDGNGAPAYDLPDPGALDWQIKGTGDFNGDGYSDILWKHKDGQVSIWFMQHGMHVGETYLGPVPAGWEIKGVGDFDGDAYSDILWRNTDGSLALWFRGSYHYRFAQPTWQNRSGWVTGNDWTIHGVVDVNADGRADILWRHTNGTVSIWAMAGGTYLGESAYLPMDNVWQPRGVLAHGAQQLRLQ